MVQTLVHVHFTVYHQELYVPGVQVSIRLPCGESTIFSSASISSLFTLFTMPSLAYHHLHHPSISFKDSAKLLPCKSPYVIVMSLLCH